MISFDRVTVRFGNHTALQSFDLSISEQRVAVIGANGSGKSTLARLVNGLCLPSEGAVSVDGFDTKTHGRDVRRLVGFVFQNPDNQIVFPVVEDDLRFGLKNLGLGKPDIDRIVDETLARFGLADLRKRQTHTLSGGQKQMLALAGVVAMQPRYIVLDEPTTLLDLRNRNIVVQAIRSLDATAIVVTHDLDLAAGFERVVVVNEGGVVHDGEAAQAIAVYRELVT